MTLMALWMSFYALWYVNVLRSGLWLLVERKTGIYLSWICWPDTAADPPLRANVIPVILLKRVRQTEVFVRELYKLCCNLQQSFSQRLIQIMDRWAFTGKYIGILWREKSGSFYHYWIQPFTWSLRARLEYQFTLFALLPKNNNAKFLFPCEYLRQADGVQLAFMQRSSLIIASWSSWKANVFHGQH